MCWSNMTATLRIRSSGLLEQIRTIDKQRLQEYPGTLDRRFIVAADKALAISIGLAKKD